MPRLTEVQTGQAITLLMQGKRQQQVALQFGVNVSTIERLVRRLTDTGRVADRLRRGRARVTTPRQDKAIRLAHLRNRHVTATETALTTVGNLNRHIHPKTVRNRLREFGLRARRPYIGFPLTRARRARRMAWLAAFGPSQFPMRQCRRVFFTDESRFTLLRPDGRRLVYRRRAERCTDASVLERDRFRGGYVMFWGGISHGLKSPLIVITGKLTGVRYRDEIFRPVAVPFVQQYHLIFQQDNARPHVASVCQDFLANHNINLLYWPPYSQICPQSNICGKKWTGE
jgi:transposase